MTTPSEAIQSLRRIGPRSSWFLLMFIPFHYIVYRVETDDRFRERLLRSDLKKIRRMIAEAKS